MSATIGKAVKRERGRRKLSQEALAAATRTSVKTVQRIEQGAEVDPARSLAPVLDFLGLDANGEPLAPAADDVRALSDHALWARARETMHELERRHLAAAAAATHADGRAPRRGQIDHTPLHVGEPDQPQGHERTGETPQIAHPR